MGVYLFGMIKDRDSYDRNGDGFSDIPKLNSETAGFRAYYKTSPYTRLTAEYHHIHEFRRGGNEFDQPPHMADIAEQLNHKIDGGGLKFDWFSPNNRHRMGIYTSAQNIDRDSYFGTDKNPDAYGATDDKTFVAGAQYTYSFHKLLFLPSELTAGVEYNYNTLHDKYLGFGRDFEQTTHSTGFFFQNEWRSEKLNFLIGGRVDKHNMMKNVVFSPRVNVRYSPTEKIGLRASYSSGYRAPQAYNEDLHIDALDNKVAIIRLAPDLKPEYSHSLSASVDLYHNFGRVQANLLVEGFYTMLEDVFTLEKIGEDAQGNIIKERRNASGATVAGVGAEAKAGIPGRFELQLGYTFQRSRYDEPEKWSDDVTPQRRMFRSPDHYGYLTANVNLTRVRQLHGPDARAAQCWVYREGYRASDARFLGYGPAAVVQFPAHETTAAGTECRGEKPFRQLPEGPRFRPEQRCRLYLRSGSSAHLLYRSKIRAVTKMYRVIRMQGRFLHPNLYLELEGRQTNRNKFSPFRRLGGCRSFVKKIGPAGTARAVGRSDRRNRMYDIRRFLHWDRLRQAERL